MSQEQRFPLLEDEADKEHFDVADDEAAGNGFVPAYTSGRSSAHYQRSFPLFTSLARCQRLAVPGLATLSVVLAGAVMALLMRPPTTVMAPPPKGVTLCEQSVRFDCGGCIPSGNATKGVGDWRFTTERDERNYGLTHDQCNAAFPGLFTEIELTLKRHKDLGEAGRISQRTFDEQNLLPYTLRAMVYDGELFVIENHNVADSEGLYYRVRASLADLNRAIGAAQEPVPDVEFAMHDADFVDPADSPLGPYWTYTRKNSWNNSWLMPDFGFYSWPQPKIGTYQEVRRKMAVVDSHYHGIKDKIPKMFWRGSATMDADLRADLLAVSKGKEWADIEPLVWADKEDLKAKYIPIEDHCNYAMLIHTEGRSYSGRLKYLQNCHSLVFAHKLQWIQPFEYLLVHEGPNQNYVEVERDFSDLEEKVLYYMEHQDEAQRIVDNMIRIFHDRYTTPAANSCYWRRLLRAWAETSDPPAFTHADGSWRGVPWESVGLMNMIDWEPF